MYAQRGGQTGGAVDFASALKDVRFALDAESEISAQIIRLNSFWRRRNIRFSRREMYD
jgi:hypothetical protein